MAAWGMLRMAAGVILNLIISTNPFLAIILLQAIAFSRSSYLAGINVAVAYRMVINLLPLGEGWDGASMLTGMHPWHLLLHCYTLLYIPFGAL